MSKINPKVFVSAPYIGNTGYNAHTRDFFRHLSKLIDIKVRNFTIGNGWDGFNDECHNSEPYINDIDKKILYSQTLWENQNENLRNDELIYKNYPNEFKYNVNLILSETNHNYFYDEYKGPKIGYNVWESTLQPKGFFDKLLEFDQIWVPSRWQADCTIAQGANPDKVKVVPEGVDINTFNLEKEKDILPDYNDGRFKFILFGRWDYRKSTREIIQTFLKTFDENEQVDLILSVDNKFGHYADGCNTTEERLNLWNIPLDPRLKFKQFLSREDYISFLKSGHIFLSCARSEGWNLPLIEAMSCGTPSIYSECSAQLEFAEGKGLPVKVLGEKPCQSSNSGKLGVPGDDNDIEGFTQSLEGGEIPGNYYEPDFNDLAKVMRDAYENYDSHKLQALEDAKIIHKDFNWDKVAEIGRDTLQDFMDNYKEPGDENEIIIELNPKPKVEIKGRKAKMYEVEFIDGISGDIIFRDKIANNMWCSLDHMNNSLIIKINGMIVDDVSKRLMKKTIKSKEILSQKSHLIDFHSNSLGDHVAIMVYLDLYSSNNNVKVYLRGNEQFSTLFKKTYPNIIITGRNDEDFNNSFDKIIHINHNFSKPLQQNLAEQLGFEDCSYIRPKIDSFKKLRPIKGKYVTIGIHSTAQCKYWNHPGGKEVQNQSPYWKELCKMLRKSGITPVCVELNKEYGLPPYLNKVPSNAVNKIGMPLEEVLNYIEHSEFYIGLGSGMTWVAHALGKPVAMISNFSKDWAEFDISTKDYKRINNTSVCHGCWNTHDFDAEDWYWCPEHKDTDRQFECHTSITPKQVFNQIKEWI